MTATPSQVPVPATPGASLDARSLLDAVIKAAGLADHEVPRLLGPDRFRPTVLKVEECVGAHRILTDRELLQLKVDLARLQPVDTDAIPTTELGADNARKAAAITLARPDGTAQLAVADPHWGRIKAVAEVLGYDPSDLDVRITTIRQLQEWIAAVERYRAIDPDLAVEVATQNHLPDVWTLLDELIASGGSDLHLQIGDPPVIRVDGDLRRLGYEPCYRMWIRQAIQDLAGRDLTDEFSGHTNVNVAVRYGTRRLRLVIARSESGPTLVARLLSEHIPPPEQLGLPTAVRDWVDLRSGLVLVTGITGSGKSTTLASLMDRMAQTRRRKVVTLEDPIEFRLPGGMSLVDQRQLHEDFPNFPTAISTVLRQDPDVILIGEMRDVDTIRAAVEAADTGHLVMSTLHTSDAASSVARVIDFFPAGQQPAIRSKLAYVLRGIVSQTLLKKASGTGRVAAFEVMRNTTAIRNLLESPDQLKQIPGYISAARSEGMQTLDQSLAYLVQSRQVTREAAAAASIDRAQFEQLLDA